MTGPSDSPASDEGSTRVAALPLDRLPRGQLEWSGLVDALSRVDDRAERYFLELKSQLDLSSERAQAKVAKFILGAANRDPDKALKRFQGHALLVIGIVDGVPFFEAKDLARSVTKFIGADGPRWDFERIQMTENKEVVVIVVDPPRWGDPVYTCLKDGHENLRDGGIYVRADGETREARGDEVRVLLTRSHRATPDAEFAVTLLGSALYFDCSNSIVNEYVEQQQSMLLEGMAEFNSKHSSPFGALQGLGSIGALGSRAEPRTQEQFEEQVSKWGRDARDNWHAVLDRVAGLFWKPSQIRVENLTKAFLEEVEITIHIDGPVRAVGKLSSDEDPLDPIPRQPRRWGPVPLVMSTNFAPADYLRGYSSPVINSPYGSISFENGGSVTLSFSLKELRPLDSFITDDDEIVLVLDQPITRLAGRWQITARGHHERYEGALENLTVSHRDFTSVIRKLVLNAGD